MKWRLGVGGSPIAHSLSPTLHEAGLRLARLEGSSARVELAHDETPRLRELMSNQFDALSITMPLKGVAGALCDELDDVAARTASVNSLLVRDGRLLGASTDGDGFVGAVAGELGIDVSGGHAVILGTGGAARAIVDALVRAGVSTVVVHGHTEANVNAIVSQYRNVFDFSLTHRPVDLLVNTVPVAARGTETAVMQGVNADTVTVDIAYDPFNSQWRTTYERAGCRTMNGLAMLAYQAALQMQWWWGVPIDAKELLGVVS